jgi:glycosyltransferase involved in cell wall biosynthesis
MNIALLLMGNAWGGAEIHAVRLARTLAERGHTATLVCLTDLAYEVNRERVGPEVPLVCLPIPRASPRDMGFRDWLRLFARQAWDVCVLIKSEFHAGGSWAIDLAARYRFGSYMVLEQLDAEPLPPKTNRRHLGMIPGLGLWWYREHLRRFLRSVAPRTVVCVSDANRRRLIQDHRFPARKVVTVQNGIDPERFVPDRAHAETWRRRWGVPSEALVFGAVGRFDAMKGYDILLASFQAVLEHFPERDLRLVLIGEGTHESALKTQAEEILPRNRVIFSPFCGRPWEPLNALDVFVMPSRNEGLPMALAEAMACGCCPVATAVGGIPELVSRSDLGWLVPAADVGAFATAMIDAASRTPEERAEIGRRAREHVVKHFNAEIQFDALAKVVESLGPGRPPRGGRARGGLHDLRAGH